MIAPGPLNSICDVAGITVGNAENHDLTTGVTVDNATTGVSVDGTTSSGTVGSATTGISLSETGDGEEFSVRPKSIAIHYFIKARA